MIYVSPVSYSNVYCIKPHSINTVRLQSADKNVFVNKSYKEIYFNDLHIFSKNNTNNH